MKEQWLPVPNFVGLYQVSDLGRVRSCKRAVFTTKGRAKNGRWIPIQEKILRPRRSGYPQVILRKDKSVNLNVRSYVSSNSVFWSMSQRDGMSSS
jgi:NUMOD4 motif